MIIVTGGAGFIGSRLIKALNQLGRTDILVVDDLTNGKQCLNLADLEIMDYIDKADLFEYLDFPEQDIEVIFHQGACSATTEWNGQYLMKNNYEYSKQLLHYCLDEQVPLIYASSASVYGDGQVFVEQRSNEKPLNMYAYSKFLFDQYVRRHLEEASAKVIGLRYFNVYGPGEAHKGSMASVVFHFNESLKAQNELKLFEGSDGYAAGEQRRDFIYVDDVVAVNLWAWQEARNSGIFNCGTGESASFNTLAHSVIDWHQRGAITYVPFPEHLKGAYQSFTEADISALRQAGYTRPFLSVPQGVKAYLDEIHR